MRHRHAVLLVATAGLSLAGTGRLATAADVIPASASVTGSCELITLELASSGVLSTRPPGGVALEADVGPTVRSGSCSLSGSVVSGGIWCPLGGERAGHIVNLQANVNLWSAQSSYSNLRLQLVSDSLSPLTYMVLHDPGLQFVGTGAFARTAGTCDAAATGTWTGSFVYEHPQV